LAGGDNSPSTAGGGHLEGRLRYRRGQWQVPIGLNEVVAQNISQRSTSDIPRWARVGFISHVMCVAQATLARRSVEPLEIPFELRRGNLSNASPSTSDEGLSAVEPQLTLVSEFVAKPASWMVRSSTIRRSLGRASMIEPWISRRRTTSRSLREGSAAAAVARAWRRSRDLQQIARAGDGGWRGRREMWCRTGDVAVTAIGRFVLVDGRCNGGPRRAGPVGSRRDRRLR